MTIFERVIFILTCKLGNEIINCYDGRHNKEQLKKWASKRILLCPVCGKPYEYCHGRVVSPYFRHMDKVEYEDMYSEPETQEHIQGKIALYKWVNKQPGVTNAVLEGWLPETKQRSDILFNFNGKKYVIEYQCSPIASEYFERHELYQAAGIMDFWICGTLKYIGENFRHKTLEDYNEGYYDSLKQLYFPGSNTEQGKFIEQLKNVRHSNINSYVLCDNSITHRSYIGKSYSTLIKFHSMRTEYKNNLKKEYDDKILEFNNKLKLRT